MPAGWSSYGGRPTTGAQDVTHAPFNVRSRVHEYGGGAYDVSAGVLVFCNFDDRRVYRVDLTAGDDAAVPRPITPEGPLRYGDLRLVDGGTALLAVCEDHGTGGEPANRLVRLDLAGDNLDGGLVLVEGPDFVSSAALSVDGTRLAWLQWDHPNMPWDGCELCVADLAADGQPATTPGSSRVAPASRRPNPSGLPTGGWSSSPTGPAGGTSTRADVDDGSADPDAPLARQPRVRATRSGCWERRRTASPTTGRCSARGSTRATHAWARCRSDPGNADEIDSDATSRFRGAGQRSCRPSRRRLRRPAVGPGASRRHPPGTADRSSGVGAREASTRRTSARPSR